MVVKPHAAVGMIGQIADDVTFLDIHFTGLHVIGMYLDQFVAEPDLHQDCSRYDSVQITSINNSHVFRPVLALRM
jgi:hypothetical protein